MREDIRPRPEVEVGVEGCVRRSVVLAKATNAGEHAGHWAEVRVAAAGVANPFTANPILLACEDQGDKGDGVQAFQRTGERIQGRIPNPQCDVLQTEQVVTATRVLAYSPGRRRK
jgi:hypothetical protein